MSFVEAFIIFGSRINLGQGFLSPFFMSFWLRNEIKIVLSSPLNEITIVEVQTYDGLMIV
jgi:hypothetical protein